jgi:glucose/mannose transport system permease protein
MMADIAIKGPATGTNRNGVEPRGPKPKRITIGRVVLYAILILAALYYLVPLWVMIMTSLKSLAEIREGNIFTFPREASLDAWFKAWDTACTGLFCEGLKVGFWNSIKIAVPSVVISIVIAAVNGYALANWKFKGAEVIFTILLFGAFIPYQVLIYPIVIILREFGPMAAVPFDLLGFVLVGTPYQSLVQAFTEEVREISLFGTLPGIIIVHTIFGMPILTLLFRNYFASLPPELFKSARVDGAGFWRILIQVMAPMALPILTVALILQVTGIWNDFLFGVIYAGRENLPMTIQLNNIVNSSQGAKEWNVNMAATVITALVPLVIYFVSGKLFVRGIAAGAVKG